MVHGGLRECPQFCQGDCRKTPLSRTAVHLIAGVFLVWIEFEKPHAGPRHMLPRSSERIFYPIRNTGISHQIDDNIEQFSVSKKR